ncbi:hypothetical protein D3C72_2561680 [compost metagenome]
MPSGKFQALLRQPPPQGQPILPICQIAQAAQALYPQIGQHKAKPEQWRHGQEVGKGFLMYDTVDA